MFLFVRFAWCGVPSGGNDDGCGSPISHKTAQNDIVSPLKSNTKKLLIKSSWMSQINQVSCTELDCNYYWTAPIGTIKQHWIQYEYINNKAKIAKYFLGDATPLCSKVGWALSGSNDNDTFYTIDAQTYVMKSDTISHFEVSQNQYYYRYIRLTFTETSDCKAVSLGFFTMEGVLKKWKNAICTPFAKKGIYMTYSSINLLVYMIVCLS